MLVSIKWLKDYVAIEITPKELAEKLTMAGLEVEEIKEIRPQFSGVIVAEILSVRPHPSADHLSLCEVSDGRNIYPVVCGAKNIAPGNRVALAKVGAVIPGGYTIKSANLRGEKSEGMLCSEAELELGEDTSGIMQLPPSLALGKPLDEALDISDTVLDVNITPNRPDCLSVIGMAREVSALTGKKLKNPSVKLKESDEDIHALTSVTILDDDLCPRYTARLVKNVRIGPSPIWMKSRLEAVGLRSINNVVDVTNFVMLEMGQPLHAFDYRLLEEGRIVVRRARQNEEFISLDGKSRVVPDDTLLICDGVKPVAIAGIMGGLNSEVQEDTQTVLLESAYFNPASIRRSSKKLSMPTEAAFRFERGIDPEGMIPALNRAAELIAEFAGGNVCKNYIDVYPRKISCPRDIVLRVERVEKITGVSISSRDIRRILRSIGMNLKSKKKGQFEVTPPTCRVDITREIDLIEEIIRLYGYEKVPLSVPSFSMSEVKSIPRLPLEERIRKILTGIGFSEVINYSFESSGAADILSLPADDARRKVVRIRNPLSEEMSVMRSTLTYGLLSTAKRNIHNGSSDFRLFEIGKVFKSTAESALPDEMNVLGGIISGRSRDTLWNSRKSVDFYDLKGAVENILMAMKIHSCRYDASITEPFLHPGKSCGVLVGGRKIGFMGEVHPDVTERFDLRNKLYLFEMNMDILTELQNVQAIKFREIPKFPPIIRDAAFIVPEDLEAGAMIEIILEQKEDLLENVIVFDVYRGKEIQESMKNLGLRFWYRAPDKTLTDADANSVHERIVKKLISATGAKMRS